MNINHDITAYEKTMKQYWLVNERTYGDYEIQHSKKSWNAPQAWWPLLSGQSAIITMRKKTTKVKWNVLWLANKVTADDIQKVHFSCACNQKWDLKPNQNVTNSYVCILYLPVYNVHLFDNSFELPLFSTVFFFFKCSSKLGCILHMGLHLYKSNYSIFIIESISYLESFAGSKLSDFGFS